MTENQFIMDKGKESKIYSAFPIWTIPQSNLIVDKGKADLIKLFQLIYENKIIRISPLCNIQISERPRHWALLSAIVEKKTKNQKLYASWYANRTLSI